MFANSAFCPGTGILMLAVALGFPAISQAAGAARIDFSSGQVMAVSTSGGQRAVTKGAEIANGEAVVTGTEGRAQLRFSDGAMISLQPGTEFKIDNYQFSGKGGDEERGFFSLIKGGMRTITGLIGRSNRGNYKVTTSVATIGIRGTEYTAGYASDNEVLVHTGEGLVEVCTGAGCVVLGAGESGSAQKGQQPKRTELRPQLPPAQPDGNVMPVFSTGDDFASLYIPTSPMPTTGSANYSTIITQSGGATGQLSSASIGVNFGTSAVSASLAGTAYGQTFSISGSGSVAGNTMTSSLSGYGGTFCAMSCSGTVKGTFYGTGAERLGIDYEITKYMAETAKGAALISQ